MPVTLPAVGSGEAMNAAQIRAQVTGQLVAIHFTEGQDVEKGQRLFSLDARPYQAALQQAEAVLARDEATLANSRLQQSRLESLFKRGIISKDAYDTQTATASAQTATVDADKAAVETARLNIQFTEIKAPISGRTGGLNAHVGDMVRSSDATPLIVINQMSPMYVTFSVPGRFLGDIRRYQAKQPLQVTATIPGAADAAPSAQAAAVVVPGAPGADVGTVSFIDNAVDTTTGTIKLKATFPNSERHLWPGAFVRVTLQLSTETSALVVPAKAVQASQDGQYVYVVKADRTVEMHPVVVSRQQGDEMVIAQGVNAGDVVVTDGHLRLVPGATVTDRGDAAGGGAAGGRGAGAPTGGQRTGARGGRS
jgi:membrane fusion protein, multidrug efflux system